MPPKPAPVSQRGFTLFEFSIVLAMATLIAAAVFALARGARDTSTLSDTSDRINALITAAATLDRRAYTDNTDVTQTLIDSGQIPGNWVDLSVPATPAVAAPWGGTMRVWLIGTTSGFSGSVPDHVRIFLVGMPTTLCRSLVAQQRQHAVRMTSTASALVYLSYDVAPTEANLTTMCNEAPAGQLTFTYTLPAAM